ncbi:glucodextranase DOMON-like domain-containing protein [Deinococcus malanensis]|uniref:glucodextranase DOMON-like domain-containing protein n=1 Tax=Deinococcus malanensis TaxID=1706855 RepID=UPI00363E0632
MLLPLLTAALMTFQDPVGDARGDGGYILPQRPALTEPMLDLRSFSVQTVNQSGRRTMRLIVGLGEIGNPWQAPSGFSANVTDIFVRTSVGGSRTLGDTGLQVRGPGGWQYHLRVTGFGSTLHAAPTEPGGPSVLLAAPTVRVEGTRLVIDTGIPAGRYAYWVTSSVYSPLSSGGVMQPSESTSPLALQAARAGGPSPVDVLASLRTPRRSPQVLWHQWGDPRPPDADACRARPGGPAADHLGDGAGLAPASGMRTGQ